MQLYLLRHGIAEDYASSDSERKLTDEGKAIVRKMMQAAAGMGLTPPAVIANSPLIRAEQTADIAHQEFAPKAARETSAALVPGADCVTTMSLVQELSTRFQSIMLVGHEPHLSSFASALVAGTARPVIEVEKSSLLLIELTNLEVPRMRGYLRMLLPAIMTRL